MRLEHNWCYQFVESTVDNCWQMVSSLHEWIHAHAHVHPSLLPRPSLFLHVLSTCEVCVCEGNNGKRPGTISHVRWTVGRHMEGASRVQDQCSH